MATANPIEIQKYLKGVDYPASRDDLVSHAEEQGANNKLLKLLEQIPADEYETPAEVSKAIGNLE
ncbi:MAG: DUF2795 domain-containing protein [Leptolyngbyaceae bacterium]|nr:DUF2795 domain-containing protein [Leptolyngbyaceae bacterium]